MRKTEQYSGSYRELLGMMIGEWRALWSENLPFLIVQLPQWINGKTAADGNDPMRWPVLREAQWDAAQSIDNVYAICTIDCGEYDNIHPLDKRTPGERLPIARCGKSTAWIAFRCTARRCWASDATRTAAYACSSAMRTVCISKAPRPAAATMISMASCDFGARAGRSGFELAGSDGMFHPATAAIFVDCDIDDLVNSRVNVVDYNATEFGIPINSRSIGTITLATPDVPEPVAMRYAWRSWSGSAVQRRRPARAAVPSGPDRPYLPRRVRRARHPRRHR